MWAFQFVEVEPILLIKLRIHRIFQCVNNLQLRNCYLWAKNRKNTSLHQQFLLFLSRLKTDGKETKSHHQFSTIFNPLSTALLYTCFMNPTTFPVWFQMKNEREHDDNDNDIDHTMSKPKRMEFVNPFFLFIHVPQNDFLCFHCYWNLSASIESEKSTIQRQPVRIRVLATEFNGIHEEKVRCFDRASSVWFQIPFGCCIWLWGNVFFLSRNMMITKTMKEKPALCLLFTHKMPRNRKHCTRVHPWNVDIGIFHGLEEK